MCRRSATLSRIDVRGGNERSFADQRRRRREDAVAVFCKVT